MPAWPPGSGALCCFSHLPHVLNKPLPESHRLCCVLPACGGGPAPYSRVCGACGPPPNPRLSLASPQVPGLGSHGIVTTLWRHPLREAPEPGQSPSPRRVVAPGGSGQPWGHVGAALAWRGSRGWGSQGSAALSPHSGDARSQAGQTDAWCLGSVQGACAGLGQGV